MQGRTSLSTLQLEHLEGVRALSHDQATMIRMAATHLRIGF